MLDQAFTSLQNLDNSYWISNIRDKDKLILLAYFLIGNGNKVENKDVLELKTKIQRY